MNCFQLLRSVLDEVWAELSGSKIEKVASIRAQLRELHNRYNHLLSSPGIVDYRLPETRFAYLGSYVTSHANMVVDLLGEVEVLQLIGSPTLQILSVQLLTTRSCFVIFTGGLSGVHS